MLQPYIPDLTAIEFDGEKYVIKKSTTFGACRSCDLSDWCNRCGNIISQLCDLFAGAGNNFKKVEDNGNDCSDIH